MSKWEQKEKKTNQLSSYPKPERRDVFYMIWLQDLAKPQDLQFTKKNFIFNIRLNQTRMKSPLNYPEIRHALELINFSFHFQKPLIITSPGQENHKFQNFQFQKKPASLQWYPFSSLHWGDLEAADAEEGMSWCNCSPQKERICDCVQFASSQGRASSKPHLETGKTLLSLRPL